MTEARGRDRFVVGTDKAPVLHDFNLISRPFELVGVFTGMGQNVGIFNQVVHSIA